MLHRRFYLAPAVAGRGGRDTGPLPRPEVALPSAPQPLLVLPNPSRWQWWLLAGLFGAYVVELVAFNAGAPVYGLAWASFSLPFEIWQPLTHFLVQGNDRSAVVSVGVSLLLLYFFLPTLETLFERRALATAVACGAAVGVALPLTADALGLAHPSYALGWGALTFGLVPLVGLARPDQQILLVILPVRASWLVWGALVYALLLVLVEWSLESFEVLGVWLGTVAWFHLLGPGRRRRTLVGAGRKVEKELRRFEVFEGGRSRPNNRPDDVVHRGLPA